MDLIYVVGFILFLSFLPFTVVRRTKVNMENGMYDLKLISESSLSPRYNCDSDRVECSSDNQCIDMCLGKGVCINGSCNGVAKNGGDKNYDVERLVKCDSSKGVVEGVTFSANIQSYRTVCVPFNRHVDDGGQVIDGECNQGLLYIDEFNKSRCDCLENLPLVVNGLTRCVEM